MRGLRITIPGEWFLPMTPTELKSTLGGRKLVVITGASKGIGAACLEKLVSEGCSVLGLDISYAVVEERHQHGRGAERRRSSTHSEHARVLLS
jgi:NAD(P)-dependent dehydrogenase (short-subunit alcohol dehydrogenase family)